MDEESTEAGEPQLDKESTEAGESPTWMSSESLKAIAQNTCRRIRKKELLVKESRRVGAGR